VLLAMRDLPNVPWRLLQLVEWNVSRLVALHG
jgi:hypothetical protein